MYTFHYDAGTAYISYNGRVTHEQPYNPTTPNQQPWVDYAEAEAWAIAEVASMGGTLEPSGGA